jgi:hypothetical protein
MPVYTSDGDVFDNSFEQARSDFIDQPFDTHLSAIDEGHYRVWKQQNAPKDSGEDYDFRGAFKHGITADTETGHWPDTFKKPNHPTFSNESIYANQGLPGEWFGENHDQYVPRAQNFQTGKDMLRQEYLNRTLDPVPSGRFNDQQTETQKFLTWRDTGKPYIEDLRHDENLMAHEQGVDDLTRGSKDEFYSQPYTKGKVLQPIADVNRGRPYPQSDLETEGARGIAGGYARSQSMRDARKAEAAKPIDPEDSIDQVAVRLKLNNHVEADRGVIHGDLIDRIADKFKMKQVPYDAFESGYLGKSGRFYDREQALGIAERHNQITRWKSQENIKWGEVGSEDLPDIGPFRTQDYK